MDDQLSRVRDSTSFVDDEPIDAARTRTRGRHSDPGSDGSAGSPIGRIAVACSSVVVLFVVGVIAGAGRNVARPPPAPVMVTQPTATQTVYRVSVGPETNYGPATREQKATDEASATMRVSTQVEASMPVTGWQQVGINIAPGRYRAAPQFPGEICHWQRISLDSQQTLRVLAEALGTVENEVVIEPSDALFFSHGCSWTQA